MESSNLQTSFIPKKNLIPGAGGSKQHKNINFFAIIAVIIFITVIAICVAAFIFNIYLNKSVENAKQSLENQLTALDPDLIGTLSELDARIETSKRLLNQHVAVSGFFDFLSQNTLQNVQFTNFSYVQKNQTASVDLSGSARSFAAVSSQSSLLMQPEKTKYFQNPVFSGFNLDTNGNVTFSVTGDVKPSVFSYRSLVTAAPTTNASSTTQ